MRIILIIGVVLTACLAASSTPISQSRLVVNRPPADLESRVKRSDQYVKGYSGNKTQPPPAPKSLRKGEYMCGDRVCKLRPGDKPPCAHCQYPV